MIDLLVVRYVDLYVRNSFRFARGRRSQPDGAAKCVVIQVPACQGPLNSTFCFWDVAHPDGCLKNLALMLLDEDEAPLLERTIADLESASAKQTRFICSMNVRADVLCPFVDCAFCFSRLILSVRALCRCVAISLFLPETQ